MKQARILDIKHFAVHDGPGIRTTVFFKGCPLKCIWCHNPEGIESRAQIGYVEKRCIGCGECTRVCGANVIENGTHCFDRSKCNACGKCEQVCLGEAFTLHGKMMTGKAVFEEVVKDKDFYHSSGGGVTLSGGECLLQYEFCRELLTMCRKAGISTAVDTCGYVTKEAIDAVSPYTDLFLYDIKAIDEEVHMKCTGKSNHRILENLRYIDSLHIPVEIRIPFVPKYNDDQIGKIAEFLKDISSITTVKLLPYHNMAGSKYEAVGMENTMPAVLPTEEQLQNAVNELRRKGLAVVR